MAEMVEFFKLSYYSYRGGKKLRQICSATCIHRTVFELKNILASICFASMPLNASSCCFFLPSILNNYSLINSKGISSEDNVNRGI